ncbi:MAG TPA: hypothetical protein VHG93_19055 [Longimicrobium sp.]|nr:hypothetical protein [Longimicrobium sp.]
MTKHLLRLAAAGAAVIALHVPALAQAPVPVVVQDSLPAPLPWGINGAQVAAALEAGDFRVMAARAGRDVHASSANRHLQAVAILKSDSLVGLVYFHPENAALNALQLFTQTVARVEAVHGPPFCRKSDLAVWTLENARLEVRLRRSVGDGAPGAEIRYIGPGYVEEMSRRTAHRPGTPRPSSTARSSGPRLLGTPVAPPAPAEPAPVPAPAPAAPAAEACVASA